MSSAMRAASFAFVFFILGVTGSAHAQTYVTVPVQGFLTDTAGVPIDGTTLLGLALYPSEVGGTPVFSETQTVEVSAGFFTAHLGDVAPLDAALFRDDSSVFVGLRVGTGDELTPRIRFGAAPYAAYAVHAGSVAFENVTGLPAGLADGDDVGTTYTAGEGIVITDTAISVDPTTLQRRITSSCPAGQAIRAIAADGTVSCEADDDTNTTYAAGTGLTLTGTTFSVNPALVQTRVVGACGSGQAITAINDDGAVVCTATGALYAAGTGLTLSGTTFSIDTTTIQRRVTGSCPSGAISAIGADGAVTCAAGGGAVISSTQGTVAPGGFLSIAGGPALTQVWSRSSGGDWKLETGLGSNDCEACGNGSDGAFSVGFVTTVPLPSREYNFTDFVIPSGVTVRPTGTAPLIIRSRNPIVISGLLDLRGGDGGGGSSTGPGLPGAGGAGGFAGGGASLTSTPCSSMTFSGITFRYFLGPNGAGPEGGAGAGCADGTAQPGTNSLSVSLSNWYVPHLTATTTFRGGSGGAGGSRTLTENGTLTQAAGAGGGGGGAVLLVAPSIEIRPTGVIDVRGGLAGRCGWLSCCGVRCEAGSLNGAAGAGGSVWLRAGSVNVQGAVETGTGLLRVDAHELGASSVAAVSMRGATEGLPALTAVDFNVGGTTRVFNNRSQARELQVIRAQ